MADKNFLQFKADRVENNPISVEDYYILGIEAFAGEDYETAHEHFTKVLELRPDWPEGYLARGRNFTKRRLYTEAIRDLSKGLQLSADPPLFAARCFAHLKLGELNKALQDCNQAISCKPDNIWVPFNYRGFVHYLLGKDQEAIDDWKHAAEYLSRPSSKALPLENLSLVYLRAGDWRQALGNADYVDTLSEQRDWNCLFRGIAADQLGEKEIAEDALNCWHNLATPSAVRTLRGYLPPSLHCYLESEALELTSTR